MIKRFMIALLIAAFILCGGPLTDGFRGITPEPAQQVIYVVIPQSGSVTENNLAQTR